MLIELNNSFSLFSNISIPTFKIKSIISLEFKLLLSIKIFITFLIVLLIFLFKFFDS